MSSPRPAIQIFLAFAQDELSGKRAIAIHLTQGESDKYLCSLGESWSYTRFQDQLTWEEIQRVGQGELIDFEFSWEE